MNADQQAPVVPTQKLTVYGKVAIILYNVVLIGAIVFAFTLLDISQVGAYALYAVGIFLAIWLLSLIQLVIRPKKWARAVLLCLDLISLLSVFQISYVAIARGESLLTILACVLLFALSLFAVAQLWPKGLFRVVRKN